MPDDRIGTVMIHPMFGDITITDIRKINGYILAYYSGSFCNINTLRKKKSGK